MLAFNFVDLFCQFNIIGIEADLISNMNLLLVVQQTMIHSIRIRKFLNFEFIIDVLGNIPFLFNSVIIYRYRLTQVHEVLRAQETACGIHLPFDISWQLQVLN